MKRSNLLNNNVSPKSVYNLPTNSDREPDSALPESRSETYIDNVEFTKPENVQPRTESLPGAQYGVPYKEDGYSVTRRTMTANVVDRYMSIEEGMDKEGELEEENAWKRQKKQKGRDKQKSKKYYRKNKQKILKRQKKYQRKPSVKKQIKKRRQKNKNRNTTRRASVLNVVHAYTKQSNTLQSLTKGLNPSIKQNADSVQIKQLNSKNGVLLFKANDYKVKVQTEPSINVVCDCNFFQYSGPEYWAFKQGYLLGEPKGTATKPKVKDPNQNNKLCKHIVAVINQL